MLCFTMEKYDMVIFSTFDMINNYLFLIKKCMFHDFCRLK
jgi:hypothetical protein